MSRFISTLILLLALAAPTCEVFAEDNPFPHPFEGGYLLPNGWKITPIGKQLQTHDLILNILPSPDGKQAIALTGGFNPHELVVVDVETEDIIQKIPQPSAWFGMAWSVDGKKLYVSGGNSSKKALPTSPIYVYAWENGKLSAEPVAAIRDTASKKDTYWSGIAIHPAKPLLYAANRTLDEIIVFDSETGEKKGSVKTERNPYDIVLSADGSSLYVSNWGSDSLGIIDTETLKTKACFHIGDNPSDLLLLKDGRLLVCCANDNAVTVVDTHKARATETIITSLYERAPEGSTPNALAVDPDQKTLFVANGDNNNLCVVNIEEAGESDVLGFVPVGWYPSALTVTPDGKKLIVGNSKGTASYSNVDGPHSPKAKESGKTTSVKSGQSGAISVIRIDDYRDKLKDLTRQVIANCPYTDELLTLAPPYDEKSTIVPREVGAGSVIKHVIYIIKENRTYDQVLGDVEKGNGDPSLCLFGKDITPNIHALVDQYVLLDNLYCDAEVSRDGHQWTNAAYATDFNEKNWPADYAGISDTPESPAVYPKAGYIWDQCFKKGLTYRTYGEFAERQSEDGIMAPIHPSLGALHGHVAPNYLSWDARDTENAKVFIKEFDEYEKNYDSPDPAKRLPTFIVMALPEDHTHGTGPNAHTPRACVASNDYALGMIIERVSNSRYWNDMAVFVIEDDAQDGSDHVDARRTEGLVISPYSRQGIVDSTLYTTSSMLRTIELLLGLQPMSQFDAAANPMYKCLCANPNTAPYTHIKPTFDINEMNAKTAWGAEQSMQLDFSTYDRIPMGIMNEILWKSVKGADSEMPLPVHRFHPSSLN